MSAEVWRRLGVVCGSRAHSQCDELSPLQMIEPHVPPPVRGPHRILLEMADIAVQEHLISAMGMQCRRSSPKRAFAVGLLTVREHCVWPLAASSGILQ